MNLPTSYVRSLDPLNVALCGKICDKVKNLERRHPGLSGWVPNVIACILVTGSLRDTHTEVKTHKRGRGNMMTEAEVGVRQPQVKECRQPPKSERGKECVLPRSPTGSTALPTP